MRTHTEINEEIAKLKALKPAGIWASKTAASIRLMITELENPFDQDGDEFWGSTEEERMTITDVDDWVQGDTDDKPSEQWAGLVET